MAGMRSGRPWTTAASLIVSRDEGFIARCKVVVDVANVQKGWGAEGKEPC